MTDTAATPQELRALADRIESRTCTGVAASFCPVHGCCTCVDHDDRNDPGCPLHGADSSHAEAELAVIFGE